jgi:hypothetical protein
MAGIYTDIQDAVRNVVWQALDDLYPDKNTAPIIFSHMNGAEPDETYTTINLLGIYPTGRNQLGTLTDQTYQIAYMSTYEVEVRIVSCGEESGNIAHLLNHRIAVKPSVQDATRANNLGFMRKGNINHTPVRRETEWIDYHTLDITFSYQVISIETVDIIESVVAEGHLDATTGEIVVTIPVPEGTDVNPPFPSP